MIGNVLNANIVKNAKEVKMTRKCFFVNNVIEVIIFIVLDFATFLKVNKIKESYSHIRNCSFNLYKLFSNFIGRWHCDICAICTQCGSKNPEGHPNPTLSFEERETLSMIANWNHFYRVNHVTKLREHYMTLCQCCQKN